MGIRPDTTLATWRATRRLSSKGKKVKSKFSNMLSPSSCLGWFLYCFISSRSGGVAEAVNEIFRISILGLCVKNNHTIYVRTSPMSKAFQNHRETHWILKVQSRTLILTHVVENNPDGFVQPDSLFNCKMNAISGRLRKRNGASQQTPNARKLSHCAILLEVSDAA